VAFQKQNYFQRRTKPKGPRTNDRIRALEVQVISSDKKNLGTFSIKEVNNSKYHHNSNYSTYHGAIVSIVSKRADGYGCIK